MLLPITPPAETKHQEWDLKLGDALVFGSENRRKRCGVDIYDLTERPQSHFRRFETRRWFVARWHTPNSAHLWRSASVWPMSCRSPFGTPGFARHCLHCTHGWAFPFRKRTLKENRNATGRCFESDCRELPGEADRNCRSTREQNGPDETRMRRAPRSLSGITITFLLIATRPYSFSYVEYSCSFTRVLRSKTYIFWIVAMTRLDSRDNTHETVYYRCKHWELSYSHRFLLRISLLHRPIS